MVAAGDLDGDGIVDLAAGARFDIYLMFGEGGGKFSQPIALLPTDPGIEGDGGIVIADVDGDGKNDIISWFEAGDVSVDRQVNGGFATPDTIAHFGFIGAVPVQLDGHGGTDVIAVDGVPQSHVLIADGTSLTETQTVHGAAVSAADIDGDGQLDVVMIDRPFQSDTTFLEIGFNDDGTLFTGALSSPPIATAAAAGRFGNGNVVAFVDADGVSILRETSPRKFGSPQQLVQGITGTTARIVDINHDGRADILAGSHALLQCDPSGPAGEIADTVAVGDGTFIDLDGDGRLDRVAVVGGEIAVAIQSH